MGWTMDDLEALTVDQYDVLLDWMAVQLKVRARSQQGA